VRAISIVVSARRIEVRQVERAVLAEDLGGLVGRVVVQSVETAELLDSALDKAFDLIVEEVGDSIATGLVEQPHRALGRGQVAIADDDTDPSAAKLHEVATPMLAPAPASPTRRAAFSRDNNDLVLQTTHSWSPRLPSSVQIRQYRIGRADREQR
jgi:hypothetical protein